MSLVQDRVHETTTTTGTGTISLAGPSTGFRSFVAAFGTGKPCIYRITDGVDSEIGIGTVTDSSPDTLSRDVVIESTNGNNLVNWTNDNAASRDVFCPTIAQLAIGGTLSKSGAYTVGRGDVAKLIVLTSALTLTLPEASVAGDGFYFDVFNVAASSATIAPNSGDLINEVSTLFVHPGQGARVRGDATDWFAYGGFLSPSAAGVQIGSPSGGGQGPGSLNAEELYENGNRVLFTKEYVSSEQTITLGGSVSLAHGLGEKPKLTRCLLVCASTESLSGYSQGDEVEFNYYQDNSGSAAAGRGVSLVCTTSTIDIRYGAGLFYLIHKSTGNQTSTDTTNWRFVAQAYA